MITVRCFARYKALLGFETREWPLPEPATLGALLAHPDLKALPPEALLAVNQAFCGRERALREGDEVALMPPVSGG